ncbi:MAG: hypothetical protein A2X84_07300 [Desulfuromonadaceae bacterium GWC2_58_13]|nr:MAG: hypothetical protein A2X84_07300 [Desulfuromonadaceae bacterium GWC2_58_13]
MKHLALLILTVFMLFVCPPVHALFSEPVEVVVTGVAGDALTNVQSALVLPTGLVRDDRSFDSRWMDHFISQIPAKVGRALEPFGYFETITSTRLENHKKNNTRVLVDVKPGEPVRVATLLVEIVGPGEGNKALRGHVGSFPLIPDDVLRQDYYEKGKAELKATALELGFLQAEFITHEIRVNRDIRSADIKLVLDTGPQFRFGTVLMHGAPDFPEWFLKRHLSFAQGEVFSHEKLGQTQLNFLDSDRFRDVIISPLEELAQNAEVPISIQLVPSARRRLRPGIGYGTDTGPRFSLRYKDVNLFHRAHLFETDLLIAQWRQSLVSTYTIPSALNLESQTSFRLGYKAEDVDTYETRSVFAEVEQTWGFGKGRVGSVFLRLLQEDYIVSQEDDRSRMVIPGIRFARRRYKDPVRPQRGYSFSLETRGAHRNLGSDISLLQVLASGNALIKLPSRWSAFFRAEGATTVQDEPIEDVPASLRFFAGGDQSVRGYRYQSLGPKDELGETIGGKHLAVGSIELERALRENWGVAFFYDAGNAFNNLSKIEWAQGAGIGLRYYTQVGPVKVDVARQIGEVDPAWRLHLSVGFGW